MYNESATATCADLSSPLSAGQERAAIIDELRRQDGYQRESVVLQVGLEIDQVDVDAVRRTLLSMLVRHPALRTRIVSSQEVGGASRENRLQAFARTGVFEPGLYRQWFPTCDVPPLRSVDLTSVSTNDQPTAFAAVVAEERVQAFDYNCPPLLRAAMVVMNPRRCLVILTVDHIVCDARSMELLGEEFVLTYGSSVYEDERVAGRGLARELALAEQTVEFRTSLAVRYWREVWARHCEHRIAASDLPFWRTGGANRSSGTHVIDAVVTNDDERSIRRAAVRSRASLQVLFLSAYAIVLGLYTGLETVAVWTHLANRSDRKYQSTVGWLSTSNILGVNVATHRSLDDIVWEVRDAVLTAIEHPHVSLAALWNALGCQPRFGDATPLVEYQGATTLRRPDHSSGVAIARINLPEPASPRVNGVGVCVHDTHGLLRVRCVYPNALYEPHGIRDMVQDVVRVVARMGHSGSTTLQECGVIAKRRRSCAKPRSRAMSEVIVADSRVIESLPVLRSAL